MINLQLTNKEWYFLHIQIENILKEHPDNHIAKNVLIKLTESCPSLNDFKSEFENEYECTWIK
jgi:hypothetical protein